MNDLSGTIALQSTGSPVAAVAPPSMTVVVCIESGLLEPLTLRMVESLRRFGGRFASLDVVAVTPRFTPPLAPTTRRRMAELGIDHLRVHPRDPYAWHHYMNKPEALAAVEARTRSNAIAWLDSDILFLREPNELELPDGVDFIAGAPDAGVIGSAGAGDANESFWGRSAALVGKRLDDLPWLRTSDGRLIRFYVNSGVFVYRRATGFGRAYLANCKKFLELKVARTHSQVHFLDQVMLGLTVIERGLSWKMLPASSNFPVCGALPDNYEPSKVADVSVLHFHDSMGRALWGKLLDSLGPDHDRVRAWLEPQGPIELPPSGLSSLMRGALRITRGVRRQVFYARSGFSKASSRAGSTC
ncbi:hypothetical protein [Bradyrhizobium manausense]|uniref:Nucleotide-diphospho-sugar transferase domain-containing protein n=1 Tax=Bradyrhizobium manausense TaxID=989370 RepID=A0A0R3DYS1_9BRAD|nr:hypothetical protein [Bradyrhizobium manausense]KRQ12604.1 hypothetical protein AOQ71_15750 [Bradyrhizobium manausense]